MQVAVKTCAVYTDLAGRLRRLMPHHQKFYAARSSFYHAEGSIHQTASSRGFTVVINALRTLVRSLTRRPSNAKTPITEGA